jgi:hypothetical protein
VAGEEFTLDLISGILKISFRDGGLLSNLEKGPKRLEDKIMSVMQYYAPQIESYAKANAPWTDQTGNARNGLAARAGREGQSYYIVLYHQVPYGIWLEVKYDGRNAIIMPTLEEFLPKVQAGLDGIMGKI